MLRMGYMPSDFHPLLLVLGDADELRRFADVLARFSERGGPLSLTENGVHGPDTTVWLRESTGGPEGTLGLWVSCGTTRQLDWILSKALASEFAGEVLELARSGQAAGSVMLECGHGGEIKVKVSMGEWEDHFLADGAR